MAFEFWFVQLPTGERLRKESMDDAANRELNELVDRGWEPISVTRGSSIGLIGFLLKRTKDVA